MFAPTWGHVSLLLEGWQGHRGHILQAKGCMNGQLLGWQHYQDLCWLMDNASRLHGCQGSTLWGHHPGDNTAGHFVCVALSPSSFVWSLHCLLGRKVQSGSKQACAVPAIRRLFYSNLFPHDFFQTFYVYIFLAVALVWQVLRTMDSLRRQYTEDHWVIFFS